MREYFERCAPGQAGVDAGRLLELCRELQKPQYGLHALMFLRQGKVIYESYFAPYEKGERHSLFSVSKSFTAIAVLFAVQEGLLGLEDRVVSFFPDKLPSPPCPNMAAMTVRHLMMMAPGFSAAPHDFKYPHLDDVVNDFPYSYENFAYQPQTDWAGDFLHKYVEHAPGERFLYCSACTYMLSAILQRVSGQNLLEFLRPRLFEPLKIADAAWQKCPEGVCTGGWGLSLCAESLAKFAQFMLDEGRWQGRQLLEAQYIRQMSQCQILIHTPGRKQPEQFGYQVWVEGEQGIYSGVGAFGQAYVVFPEQQAVAVLLGGSMQYLRALQILRKKFPRAVGQGDADAAAERELAQLAGEARIAPTEGKPSWQEPLAARYSGREYALAQNYLGLTAIRFWFGEQDEVEIQMGRRSSRLPIGYGAFLRGKMPIRENEFMDVHNQLVFSAAACSGAWQEGKYHLRIAYTEQCYISDFEIEFAPHGIRISCGRNVGFVQSANLPILGYQKQ